MYTKKELIEVSYSLVERCKEELNKGNTRLDMNFVIDGKEYKCYIDCQIYINDATRLYRFDRDRNQFSDTNDSK